MAPKFSSPAAFAPAATPGQQGSDMRLENLTSPEVKALAIDKLIVLAPLGAFEQHGAHLPLTTDTDIVTAIANAVEATLSDNVLCLPCLWMGHSTHHMKF